MIGEERVTFFSTMVRAGFEEGDVGRGAEGLREQAM